VFGPSVYLWFVPIADKGQKANGVSWPKNQWTNEDMQKYDYLRLLFIY
jgi:hypothetical protein